MRARAIPGWVFAAVMAMPFTARAADDDLARGKYLMNGIVACGNCHSPRGPDGKIPAGQELSGGLTIETPDFRAVASNITPDKETGIGNWTDAQLVTAIREGKRPDGSPIGPPMPIEFYRNMSDNDVRAIVAALRATKPVSHAVEKSKYNIPLPPSYGSPVTHVSDVPRSNTAAYGKYLADIGHCLECHTPRVKGQLDLTRLGGGGMELPAPAGGIVVSANLTPGNPNGMAHWTNAQAKATIASGVRPDGRQLVRLMAFDWYKTIEDNDMNALVAYLKALKPVKG
jgi:mono/diheme cytochrome c family protein